MNPDQEPIPQASADDMRVRRGTTERTWTHDGKTYVAHVREPTFNETLALLNRGAYLEDCLNYWFDHLVVESNVPMDAKARLGWGDMEGLAAARGLGFLDRYDALGLGGLKGEARKNG